MKIELDRFAGMAPLVDPTALQDHFASDAENVVFNRGVISQNPLQPVDESTFTNNTATRTGVSGVQRLVYFDDGTLLGMVNDTTVDGGHGVNSLVAPRDKWDRRYYIRSGKLRVASSQVSAQILKGGYTRNPPDFILGINAPANALITAEATVGDTTDGSPRDDSLVKWTYTVVDGFGHESPPAPTSIGRMVPYNAPWHVRLSGFDATLLSEGQYTVGAKFRIYRQAFDGGTSEFQFVGEVDYGTAQVVFDGTLNPGNNQLYTDIGLGDEAEIIPSLNWDEPPQGRIVEGHMEGPMQTVVSVASNFLAGYYDNYVCYSEFKMPHAWPTQTRFPLNYPVKGLLPLDNGVLIVTTGKPYWGFGADPQSAVPVELNQNYPCIATRSLVDMGGYGVYATHDGLVGIEQGQARVLTEAYITREDWLDFIDPESMVAFAAQGRYYFSAKDGNWWVFDPADAGGFARTLLPGITPNIVRTVSFDPTKSRVVIVTTTNKLFTLAVKESGPMKWDSKVFLLAPTSFSTARVEADTYPVDMVVRRGATDTTYTVNNNRPFRIHPGLAAEWRIGIRADAGRIRKIGVAQDPAEFE